MPNGSNDDPSDYKLFHRQSPKFLPNRMFRIHETKEPMIIIIGFNKFSR